MLPGRRSTAAMPILALVITVLLPEAQAQQAQQVQQQDFPPAIRYEAHISAGGVAPAGGSLVNPHKNDPAVAKSGEALFGSMNCDGCHGGGASGFAAPSLADGRWRYGGADNEIFQSIYYGRPKGMPAFGGVLGQEGVWILVTYLQSLPPPANVPMQSWEKP